MTFIWFTLCNGWPKPLKAYASNDLISFILVYIDVHKTFRSDRENQISETNLRNLEQLKDYPYSTEIRQSSKSGKDFIMYICEFDGCKKEFLRTWNLLDHVRMHQGVKPYVWDYCPKTFTQRGNLKKHLTKHYNPSIESRRKFLCRFWSSKFTERYNYKVSSNCNIQHLLHQKFKFRNLYVCHLLF